MSDLKITRTAQWPLVAEFTFNFDDTMTSTAGASKDFGKTTVAETNSFDIINLPYGAVVIGGEVATETAFDTAGLDITVGDSASGTRYLASTDVKGAGRVALVPTGYVSDGGSVRISVQCDDVCTAGKATVRVMYTIRNRSNEVQPN
jgi:orotate phosphoribosyltransferase